MELKVLSDKNQVRISIDGNVDEVGARRLEECFKELDVRLVKDVILDFRQVHYIGSAGVGMLLLLYKKVALNEGRVIIQNIPKDIYTLLTDGMKLGRVFTMHSL